MEHDRINGAASNVHQHGHAFLFQYSHWAAAGNIKALPAHLLGLYIGIERRNALGTDIDADDVDPIPLPVIKKLQLPAEELLEAGTHRLVVHIGRGQGRSQINLIAARLHAVYHQLSGDGKLVQNQEVIGHGCLIVALRYPLTA